VKKIICAAMMMVTMLGSSVCLASPAEYTEYVDTALTYTGVIIDCRGLGLQTAMSPVIEDTRGKILYGDKNLDCDLITRRGMASYAKSFNDPAVRRAGEFPVIFKALSLAKHSTCPVLDMADGFLLEGSNKHYDYLAHCAVVFIKD
jgi:hypothetical protein